MTLILATPSSRTLLCLYATTSALLFSCATLASASGLSAASEYAEYVVHTVIPLWPDSVAWEFVLPGRVSIAVLSSSSVVAQAVCVPNRTVLLCPVRACCTRMLVRMDPSGVAASCERSPRVSGFVIAH